MSLGPPVGLRSVYALPLSLKKESALARTRVWTNEGTHKLLGVLQDSLSFHEQYNTQVDVGFYAPAV
jgi:hypothetical protein